MAVDTYTIKLKLPAVHAIAAHLRRGIYDDVKAIIDDISAQVIVQDQEAEQADLQAKVRQAGLQLVETDKSVA
jgi:hypothetical protein